MFYTSYSSSLLPLPSQCNYIETCYGLVWDACSCGGEGEEGSGTYVTHTFCVTSTVIIAILTCHSTSPSSFPLLSLPLQDIDDARAQDGHTTFVRNYAQSAEALGDLVHTYSPRKSLDFYNLSQF